MPAILKILTKFMCYISNCNLALFSITIIGLGVLLPVMPPQSTQAYSVEVVRQNLATTPSVCNTFALAHTYSAGMNPNRPISADFNGDNKPDVAVVNFDSNNLSVLLGNGDGSFQQAVNYSAGSKPYNLTKADFNLDGKIDLAVADTSTTYISVLLGNGDGTFQGAVTYGVGTDPHGIFAVDINNDNKPDIVTANEAGGNISVLLGNGNGTFQSAINTTVGSNPVWVIAADFDKNNKVDVAVVFDLPYSSSSTVLVLPGNGNGTFGSGASYTIGSRPYEVETADFNKDGTLDLVTADSARNLSGSTSDISVLLGNGNGTFQAATSYPVDLISGQLVIGDFNADGNQDVFTSDYAKNEISLLLGNGNGTFQTPLNYPLASAPSMLAATDFNGDNTLDLAVSTRTSNTLSIVLNQPNVEFGLVAPTNSLAGSPVNVSVTIRSSCTHQILSNYWDTIHFTSTDEVADLPSNYTFVAGDNGVHIFTGGVTFNTGGSHTLTVSDNVAGSVVGTASITITNFVVTLNGDNGTGTTMGSLSYALVHAIPINGQNITFKQGLITISLTTTTGLPPVPTGVTLDGGCTVSSVGGIMRGSPKVRLTSSTVAGAGLALSGNSTTVSGLAITGFGGYALDISGNNNKVTCSWLGTADGVTASPNGNGVRIAASTSNNQLGQTGISQSGNLISGNSGLGVEVQGGTNNQAYYNWIGFQSNGSGLLKNSNGAIKITNGGQLKFYAGNKVSS